MIDQILAAQREATFDFREHAHPADPLAHRFEEWVPYYRLKFAVAKALRPASILEIGVRFGYSAHAFLAAAPDAHYVGIDNDTSTFGGEQGALEWARRSLSRHRVELVCDDTQKLVTLPGGPYDLIHVDGQQDGDGTFHDLELALEKGHFILLDGLFWSRQNLLAGALFLEKYRSLIEYALAIPGYAGELLIKSRPDAAQVMEWKHNRSYASLRPAYDATYYLTDCGGHDVFQRSRGLELDDRLRAVLLLASPAAGMRVLDVGCGRGELTYALALEGAHAVGVDYSADAIGIATAAYGSDPLYRDGRLQIVEADILQWEPAGLFDLAIAADLVEHLEPAALSALVRRLATLLRKDGWLVVHTAPNLRHYQTDHQNRVAQAREAGAWLPSNPRTLYEDLMHVNEQTPETLERTLRESFPHAIVWTATLPDTGGTLRSGEPPGTDISIFAVASQQPLDRRKLLERICQMPLDSRAITVQVKVAKPAHLRPGELVHTRVKVRNEGRESIASLPPHPVHLSYHWRLPDGTMAVWDGDRTPIGRLPPGAEQEFGLRLRAPPRAGTYLLDVTLVHEGVFWFEQQHVPGLPISLEVNVS